MSIDKSIEQGAFYQRADRISHSKNTWGSIWSGTSFGGAEITDLEVGNLFIEA